MTKSEILASGPGPKIVGSVPGVPGNEVLETCSPCVVDGDFYRWNPAGSGIQIELHVETVRRISYDLLTAASREASDDVGGLLIGRSSKVAPRTFRIIAVESSKSSQLHSVLTIVTNRMAPSSQVGSVLGFYRIVARDKLVLTDLDMYLVLSRFSKDDKAFLLVEPNSGGARARFFFWSGAQRRLSSELLEFPVVESQEGEPPSGWSPEAQEIASTGLALVENQPQESSRPAAWYTLKKPVLIGLVLAIIAAAAVWVVASVKRSPIPAATAAKMNSPLDLKITPDDEGGMWLSWNTAAPVMASAQAGLVTIRDGARKSQRTLDREQLLYGKLYYISVSESVEFTAQFYGSNSMQTDSVTAFLIKPAGRDQPVDAATRSNPPRQNQNPPASAPQLATANPQIPRQNAAPVVKQQANTAKPAAVQASNTAPNTASGVSRQTPPVVNEQQANAAKSESAPAPIATQAVTPPPAREPDLQRPQPIRTIPASAPPIAERRQDSDSGGQIPAAPRTVPAIGPPQAPTASVIYPTVVRTVPAISPGGPSPKAEQYFSPKVVSQVKPTIPQNLNGMIKKDVLVQVHLSIDASGKVTSADADPSSDALYSSLAKVAIESAKRWKFEPARRGTRAEASDSTLTFKFTPAR